MTITTLEALRDAIRASKGPDRELDAAFARLVLGWAGVAERKQTTWLGGVDKVVTSGWMGSPPGGGFVPVPAYLDPLAGPGALFAAAVAGWPDVTMRVEVWMSAAGPQALAMFEDRREERHPLLCHALALAMVEAAIQERDNG